MTTLYYQGSPIECDPEGFLQNPEDWNEDIAAMLAKQDHLPLLDEHWFIIHFLRDYYAQFQHLPPMRIFIKLLCEKNPSFVINSPVLYQLFPGGPLKQAAKLAGLPKPPHCI